MASLPQTRSPWWLLLFLITAAGWFGLVLLAGRLNHGPPPSFEAVVPIIRVSLAANGVLSVLGALGLRGTFLGAHLGLLIGWAQMIVTFGRTSTDSMADLGALALFLMLGAVGLVVGLIVDIVRFVRSR